jgi:hypothetical protein
VQLLAPLSAFVAVGVVALSLRWLRRGRSRADLTPELVAGGLVSYLALTYLSLKDPRYTLAALVYMAVLGTGWLVALGARARMLATGAFLLVACVNVVATLTGAGEQVRLSLPGAPTSSGLGERQLTLYQPDGYIAGRPLPDGEVLDMLHGARRAGFGTVELDPGADTVTLNASGLTVLLRQAGLRRPPTYAPQTLTERELFLQVRLPAPDQPPPCVRMEDGRLLYLVRGNPLRPPAQLRFVCPLRRPQLYRDGG